MIFICDNVPLYVTNWNKLSSRFGNLIEVRFERRYWLKAYAGIGDTRWASSKLALTAPLIRVINAGMKTAISLPKDVFDKAERLAKKDSVANVSQVVALDKLLLTERAGKLPRAKTDLVLAGIDVVTLRSELKNVDYERSN